MSVLTEVLKLFKYDPATDGDMTFNIGQCMNDNWDKLDAAILLAIAAAGAYNPEESYAVGDYCTYKGKLRKCSTAIPTGETWTEAHWTTTTVAAEMQELSSQLSNRVNSIPVAIDPTVDVLTLKSGHVYTVEGEISKTYNHPIDAVYDHLTYNVYGSEYGSNGYKSIICKEAYSNRIWIKTQQYKLWLNWALVSLATPPQEFVLPLADGFVHYNPGTKSTYSKSQEGLVVVHFYCKTSDGADILQNTTIATLPEGFRPSANVHILANVSFDGSSVYSQDVATVVVGGNGRVWIAYPPAGCKAVTSTLVFYAAG